MTCSLCADTLFPKINRFSQRGSSFTLEPIPLAAKVASEGRASYFKAPMLCALFLRLKRSVQSARSCADEFVSRPSGMLVLRVSGEPSTKTSGEQQAKGVPFGLMLHYRQSRIGAP